MKYILAISLAAIIDIALVSGYAFARPPVYFEAPVKFRGTGCPGANSVTVSGEDATTMTVVFDQFDAARPKDNAASGNMRSSCSFVVPVKVPQGIQVSHVTADWRGYAEGKTKLHREYFIAGKRGPSADDTPKGEYTLQDNLMHTTWANSCNGGVFPMRIIASVRAQSNPSYIAVEKTLALKIKWRKCP